MHEVVYFSVTGNTKQLADTIAAELGVEAMRVDKDTLLADGSMVFVGTGLYGPYQGLKKFIDRTEFSGRKVALFGTSGEGKGKEVRLLEQLLAAKGANVVARFHCRGEFLFLLNRNRPSSADLEDARNFARRVANG